MDFILFPIAPAHDVCFQFRIEECLLWGQAVWTACILRTFIFSFFLFLSFRWSLKIWNFMVEHTHTHAHWAQHSMEHLNELQFSAEFLHIPRFFFFFFFIEICSNWMPGWLDGRIKRRWQDEADWNMFLPDSWAPIIPGRDKPTLDLGTPSFAFFFSLSFCWKSGLLLFAFIGKGIPLICILSNGIVFTSLILSQYSVWIRISIICVQEDNINVAFI